MTALLIYPPFAMPDKPYISLPVLASHLESQDIPVSCWDANLSFFRRAMAPAFLVQHGGNLQEAPRDLFQETAIGNQERLALFGHYLDRIQCPGETLSLTHNTGYLRYDADTSFFDSRALIQAARRPVSLTRKLLQDRTNRCLQETTPVVAGISVAFPDQILPALTLAAMVREIQPELPIVLGGAFATVHMQQVENPDLFDLVDVVFLGDGEDILCAIYRQVKSKGNLRGIQDLEGVVCRDDQGRIRHTTPAVYPMAEASAPAYTRLPLNRYLVPRSTGAILFRLSKGCYWGRCAFCNSLSPIINRYDRAGFEDTYQALITTLEDTQAPIVHFTDDAADPDMLAFLADRLLSEKRQIHWTVNARVDKRLTLSRLSRLRQAGCFSLSLGVESCCDRVLQTMNKGTTLKRIARLLMDLSWAGISANIYMITGFPTETEEEAEASYNQVCYWLDQDLIRQVTYNVFSISPCSPVAADPEAFGITDLKVPEGRDLCPPLSHFTCSTGMTRAQARGLCRRFTRELIQRQKTQ